MWNNGDIANGHILIDGSWVLLRPRGASEGHWRPGDLVNGHVFTGSDWVPMAPPRTPPTPKAGSKLAGAAARVAGRAKAYAQKQGILAPPAPASPGSQTPAVLAATSEELAAPKPAPMTPSSRQIDSWQTAEANAAEWMRFWGYGDAEVTGGGADGGVDVRARRAIAQVKWEASQVGSPAVQRLVGARGLSHDLDLLFFSGAGFSAKAIAYANEVGVALFKYDLVGSMTPCNFAAERIFDSPGHQANGSPAHFVVDEDGDVRLRHPKLNKALIGFLNVVKDALEDVGTDIIILCTTEVESVLDAMNLLHREPVSVDDCAEGVGILTGAANRVSKESLRLADLGFSDVLDDEVEMHAIRLCQPFADLVQFAFFDVLEEGKQLDLTATLLTEMQAIEPVFDRIGNGAVKFAAFIDGVGEIIEATDRLRTVVDDRRELVAEVQRERQQNFDAATASFFTIVDRATKLRGAYLSDAVTKELDYVAAIIEYLSTTRDVDVFDECIRNIIESRERVRMMARL
ncbi:restriction endonuclease [Nocardioides sp. NPDC127514]|uniref:restriction endonuclease n=1 Tax=unclassified Nocardioides TaxID=2615069 RepID=UPI003328C216